MQEKKRIALVAHADKKQDLLAWARFNRELLAQHELYSTATTGTMLEQELGLHIYKLRSGPLGGDQRIGARITEGILDALIYFWDPLASQAHDSDIRALLRVAVVWNVALACNRSSADFIISSPLMTEPYEQFVPDYDRLPTILDVPENHAVTSNAT
jgi:methylglyoxal synthase